MPECSLVAVRPPGFDRTAFIASTERDREVLSKAGIQPGVVITFDIKAPRHGKHHRLVFALLRFVFKNQDRYDNEEALRKALTLETSFVEEFVDLHGEIHRQPRSWSYKAMDEIEFAQLHSELIDVVLRLMWPGQSVQWLKAGVDADAAAEHVMSFA